MAKSRFVEVFHRHLDEAMARRNPAGHVAVLPAPPPPVAPPPDPARLEFERIKRDALSRQAAEKKAAAEAFAERKAAQQAEDDAVNLILSARNL